MSSAWCLTLEIADFRILKNRWICMSAHVHLHHLRVLTCLPILTLSDVGVMLVYLVSFLGEPNKPKVTTRCLI
jgi:hypothetical protein